MNKLDQFEALHRAATTPHRDNSIVDFMMVCERDAPAFIRLARAAMVLHEACHANLIGPDVNSMEHGNLVGFPIARREDAKKLCALLTEMGNAIAPLLAEVPDA